jgi:hypothetical protein
VSAPGSECARHMSAPGSVLTQDIGDRCLTT